LTEGVLVDGSNGEPLAGVKLACNDAACHYDKDGFRIDLTTNDRGHFQLDGVMPGRHLFAVFG
jgi:hypothetical protein